MAVSYTHLDVYKRQPIDRVVKNGILNLVGSVKESIFFMPF